MKTERWQRWAGWHERERKSKFFTILCVLIAIGLAVLSLGFVMSSFPLVIFGILIPLTWLGREILVKTRMDIELGDALEDKTNTVLVACPNCGKRVEVNAAALDMAQHREAYFVTVKYPNEEQFIVSRCGCKAA